MNDKNLNKPERVEVEEEVWNSWQYEETGQIRELPVGKNPGTKWYRVERVNTDWGSEWVRVTDEPFPRRVKA